MRPEPEPVRPDSEHTRRLLARAAGQDASAVDELLTQYRGALIEFVRLRLPPALRPRMDPSDVVQEAQVELAHRLSDFLARRPMPFHLWARKTAYERVLKARRTHHAACRAVTREAPGPDLSSVALAAALVAAEPSPSEAAAARERAAAVSRTIDELPEADREVLLLRHVDGLTHPEVAAVLGVSPVATRQRYGRALFRLQKALREAGVGGDD